MPLNIPAELTLQYQGFERKILEGFCKKLNVIIPSAIPTIREEVQNLIEDLFEDTHEYHSIASGILRAHFGLRDSEVDGKLDAIRDMLSGSVFVEWKPLTPNGPKTVVGGLTVYAIIKDFSDLLHNSTASIVTTDKGQDLPWLEWLLIEGGRIIISDYGIIFGDFANSRSGEALMVKSKKQKRFWRVPPEFAGTINDNWITRMIKESEAFVHTALENIVSNAIKDAI